jgi:hypothetical protein
LALKGNWSRLQVGFILRQGKAITMPKAGRAWLLAPVAVLFATDVGFTLAGQPAAYWAGNFAIAIEGNPLVRPLLAHSPGWFVAAALAWLAMLSAIILWWPSWAWGWRVAVVVAVIHAMAHALASATWLARPGGWNWLLAAAYVAVTAELSWWCWRRAGRKRRMVT